MRNEKLRQNYGMCFIGHFWGGVYPIKSGGYPPGV